MGILFSMIGLMLRLMFPVVGLALRLVFILIRLTLQTMFALLRMLFGIRRRRVLPHPRLAHLPRLRLTPFGLLGRVLALLVASPFLLLAAGMRALGGSPTRARRAGTRRLPVVPAVELAPAQAVKLGPGGSETRIELE
jgi:hypothetical protein